LNLISRNLFDLSYDLSDICDISLRVTVRNILECENGSRGGVLGSLQAGRLEHLPSDDQTSLIVTTTIIIVNIINIILNVIIWASWNSGRLDRRPSDDQTSLIVITIIITLCHNRNDSHHCIYIFSRIIIPSRE